MGVARILIWDLADSQTTLAEIRSHLEPIDDVHWIANDAQERFGAIVLGDELPDLTGLRELIGKDPDVAEEYDVEEPA